MTPFKSARKWLGPALAASLWIGFAAGPSPGLTAAEIASMWGSALHGTAEPSRAEARSAPAQQGGAATAQHRAPASTGAPTN